MPNSTTTGPVGLIARSLYQRHLTTFRNHEAFVALAHGTLSPAGYDQFILNAVSTHVNSPQLLAFLFATASPVAADNVRDNLVEELGIGATDDVSHPDMLQALVNGARLAGELDACRARAEAVRRTQMVQPMLYGSLVELGLAALVEVTAFEYFLSQTADTIGAALRDHRHLSAAAVGWFTHHGIVDETHAESGLANIDRYVDYYAMDPADAEVIVQIALRENPFVGRYLDGLDQFIDPLPRAMELIGTKAAR